MARVLTGKAGAEEICAAIERKVEKLGITGKCVHKSKKRLSGAKVILMVFEKFFARTASQTSLTVLVTDDGRKTVCELIASGGGTGIGDRGSEAEFEEEIAAFLMEKGFGE